jgi:hypothetical protein
MKNISFLINPLSIVSPRRLDIFCRLEFVRDQILDKERSWGTHLYKEFISNSSYNKFGQEIWGEDGHKFTYDDYENSFKELISSIRVNGFDGINYPIPVSKGTPVNGAHRLATVLQLNLEITTKAFPDTPPNYNYAYLRSIGLTEKSIEFCALDYIRTIDSSRYFIFFDMEKRDIEATLRKVVSSKDSIIFTKSLKLSEIGKRRLIEICYDHNDWWNSSLLENMLAERFGFNSSQVTVAFFDSRFLSGFESEVKAQLRREVERISFSQKIHGSGFHQDTRDLAELLLSQPGRAFLNHALIGSDIPVMNRLDAEGLTRDVFDSNLRTIFIGGMTVDELFGDGKSKDTEYYSTESHNISLAKREGVKAQNFFYKDNGINGEEILSNPLSHFYFRGRLFANPAHVNFIRLSRIECNVSASISRKNMDLGENGTYIEIPSQAYIHRMRYWLQFIKGIIYGKTPMKILLLYKKVKQKLFDNRKFLD